MNLNTPQIEEKIHDAKRRLGAKGGINLIETERGTVLVVVRMNLEYRQEIQKTGGPGEVVSAIEHLVGQLETDVADVRPQPPEGVVPALVSQPEPVVPEPVIPEEPPVDAASQDPPASQPITGEITGGIQ